METESSFVIESRVQLFSALAEAAEIEHNLMCLYLYAMFSLKRTEAEGVSRLELEAISRWRKAILGIALEEMNHLTLVSNLTVSIGGTPSFLRPNFPSYPGLYPAAIIIELAQFDMNTLDHFIYLERPRSQEIKDGDSFERSETYTRLSQKGRLMPTSGDYQTVGALYLSIRDAIEELCTRQDEEQLFCGPKAQQIGPLDSPLPGLTLVSNKSDALKAIETIITQGEGAADVPDSHFQRFLKIKGEYGELLKVNPGFVPARPVARNPVMRKPLNPDNRVWVTEPLASQYIDLANALYGMMLRLLVQIYAIDNRPKAAKATLLNASYGLMHAMASVAETLTHLPVSRDNPQTLSGMSFAMVRTLAPLDRASEKQLLVERFLETVETMRKLQAELEQEKEQNPQIKACVEQLRTTSGVLMQIKSQISEMPEAMRSEAPPAPAPMKESARTSAAPAQIETSETDQIELIFEAKRCIHSRHYVTELPEVFKANTPGKWLFAEKTDPNVLAGVARECPSGAIRFKRRDGGAEEPVPEVNLMRLRENGPYAFLGDLAIDGQGGSLRATLCRCGQSGNKPFRNGSHNAAKFTASGEPGTLDDAALRVRSGKLKIDRTANGPIAVAGNVEICAGSGRIVLRAEDVKLCRCGQSKSKPICDGSHVGAGFRDPAEGVAQ